MAVIAVAGPLENKHSNIYILCKENLEPLAKEEKKVDGLILRIVNLTITAWLRKK